MMLARAASRMAFVTKPSAARQFMVAVEGNIGSGKTTFLNNFRKHDNVSVLAEPVEIWRNCAGHNLLAYMYEDKARWSFSFQSFVQLTMLKHHTCRTAQPVKLMERSIYSARYCFVEKLRADGALPEPSAAVLHQWFEWIIGKADVAVDLIIYLQTSPEVVYQRMLQRNRDEEKCVSLQDLQELHKLHEDWLFNKTSFACPAPVIVMNADLDMSSITEEYKRYESFVLNQTALELRM